MVWAIGGISCSDEVSSAKPQRTSTLGAKMSLWISSFYIFRVEVEHPKTHFHMWLSYFRSNPGSTLKLCGRKNLCFHTQHTRARINTCNGTSMYPWQLIICNLSNLPAIKMLTTVDILFVMLMLLSCSCDALQTMVKTSECAAVG